MESIRLISDIGSIIMLFSALYYFVFVLSLEYSVLAQSMIIICMIIVSYFTSELLKKRGI